MPARMYFCGISEYGLAGGSQIAVHQLLSAIDIVDARGVGPASSSEDKRSDKGT